MTQEWSSRADTWAPEWVARRLNNIDIIKRCEPTSGPSLRIDRTDNLGSVDIACIAVDDFTQDETRAIIRVVDEVCFIVNVTSGARITGAAIQIAESKGTAIGGLTDVMRALRQKDPSAYKDRHWAFVEQGFIQHTAVSHFEILWKGCYRIFRQRHEPVDVAIINDYEVTAQSVRSAINKFENVDAVVNSNPYAQPIAEPAKTVASSSGTRVYSWKEFYGMLHRPWTQKRR